MDNKKAIKILKRARDLISKGWCRGGHSYAKNSTLRTVSPVSKEAKYFCAMGALAKACYDNNISEVPKVPGSFSLITFPENFLPLRALAESVSKSDKEKVDDQSEGSDYLKYRPWLLIARFNEQLAKDKRYVLRLYDRAIKSLQK